MFMNMAYFYLSSVLGETYAIVIALVILGFMTGSKLDDIYAAQSKVEQSMYRSNQIRIVP